MLEDIVVLDLSRVLAGPYCTQLLADLGATVWKVEPPNGDETREWGPPFVAGESGYYLSVNRNKRGLSIDLKHPRGAELVVRLAQRADVLVENFKTGGLERYGLGYEKLARTNPGLVYASITGYGHTGPRAREPGYDAAMQAISGLMAMTGEPGGAPVKLGVAWIDVLAGVHAAAGILAALYERRETGKGKHLDLSLFDVALASMVNQSQAALLTDSAPQRLGSAHPSIVPYQAFATASGDLVLAVGNDDQFERLCRTLAMQGLAADERFATNEARVHNREALVALLTDALAGDHRDAWLGRFREAGVPCAPVNTLPEALADDQVRSRGMVGEVEHPTAGRVPLVLSPFGPEAATGLQPPPLLGQHNAEVLGQLGLGREEIDELEREGVLASSLRSRSSRQS